MKHITELVLRSPWLVIGFFVAVTFYFAVQLPDAQIDPGLKSQLPEDFSARVSTDRIEELFGGTDILMVVLVCEDVLEPATLRRVRQLSRGFERIAQVDRVLSLFSAKDIHSSGDQMVVEPAVPRIPPSIEKREELRARLRGNDLLYGNIVSRSFRATALILQLELGAHDDLSVAAVEEVLAKHPGPEEVHISGAPFLRKSISEDISTDVQRFLPLGMLIMVVFLYLCFRQLRGVLLPLLVVLMSIIVAMGLIPVLGWKIRMVTIILPVIPVAVANDYGIHLLARYQEMNRPGCEIDKPALVRGIMEALGGPVLLTGITTIAGLLCLLSHIIVPARQLGILASAGVAFALSASLLFIPALLRLLPRARPLPGLGEESSSDRPRLERMLALNARLVARHPRIILAGSLLAALLLGSGLAFLEVDTNSINYYPKEAPLVRAAKLVNKEFGGFIAVSVVAEGDIKAPRLLRELDDLEQRVAELPDVGLSTSMASVVRRMNRAFHGDEAAEDRVPESREAIAQLFLLYSMSGDPEDFDRLVDFPYRHALLTARINHMSTKRVGAVVRFLREYLQKHESGPFTTLGGFGVIFADLVVSVVRGQILSLLLSLVLIGLLVALLFRSVTAGLLSLMPLALAMAALFGLMGFLGIELNIITAMLSSMMIGVGVDYTIHFLWRYRVEQLAGPDPTRAVVRTLLTTGRGIVFNALSVVIGFVVLMLSSFLPPRFFGFLVTVSISTCLFGALVLLPAVVIVLRPAFLEPKGDSS